MPRNLNDSAVTVLFMTLSVYVWWGGGGGGNGLRGFS